VEREQLQSVVESLLFVSGESLTVASLVKAAGVSEEEVEEVLQGLAEVYRAPDRGLFLVRKGSEVQLTTKPDNAIYAEHLVKGALQESLSKPALEVLSVIAYRGPISRAEIEAIRGVNCSMTLRNLMMRELIERTDNPQDARGYLYEISLPFLKALGLDNVTSLPDYEALRRDERLDAVLRASTPADNDSESEVVEKEENQVRDTKESETEEAQTQAVAN
jgi:segregation and condensation protein B